MGRGRRMEGLATISTYPVADVSSPWRLRFRTFPFIRQGEDRLGFLTPMDLRLNTLWWIR